MKLTHKTCPQCSGTLFKELSADEVQCEYCGTKFSLNESGGSLKKHGVVSGSGNKKNNRTAVAVVAVPPLAPGDYAPFRIQIFRTIRKPVSWVIDYSCRVEQ